MDGLEDQIRWNSDSYNREGAIMDGLDGRDAQIDRTPVLAT